jgi:hypothetical protein
MTDHNVRIPPRVRSKVRGARVIDAMTVGELIVVLLDPDEHIKPWGQYRNLQAFTANGKRVWTAELPTTTTGDAYYRMDPGLPLTAHSVMSFECVIDPQTGRIVSKMDVH